MQKTREEAAKAFRERRVKKNDKRTTFFQSNVSVEVINSSKSWVEVDKKNHEILKPLIGHLVI